MFGFHPKTLFLINLKSQILAVIFQNSPALFIIKTAAAVANKVTKILLTLFLFLSLILFGQPLLPRFFSYQDKINTNLVSNFDPSQTTAIFNNQILSINQKEPSILGTTDSPNTNKRIEVDLTNQKLYGFEDGRQIFDFTISSGLWDRTPNGTFTIWKKVRSQKMSGGSKELGTYYYLPNVPYILFFYNDKVSKYSGYSLHGTYWHNNFGVPMSHGCINMKTPDVAQIYGWAPEGTTITIYGKYSSKITKK